MLDRSVGTAIALTSTGQLIATGRRIDREIGFDIGLDISGTGLWRRERINDPRVWNLEPDDRDAVATDVMGHHFTARRTTDGLVVSKYAPGGRIGTRYCGPAVPNSTGASGQIVGIGEVSAVADNVSLLMVGLPGPTFAMILGGQTQGSMTMLGGGQGTLCLGGAIGRFNAPGELRSVGADGRATLRLTASSIPTPTGRVPILAGQTWNFQAWYRDANPNPTSNLTDAVAITFM